MEEYVPPEVALEWRVPTRHTTLSSSSEASWRVMKLMIWWWYDDVMIVARRMLLSSSSSPNSVRLSLSSSSSQILPRLAEAVVDIFVKIDNLVDCHIMIPLIDRAHQDYPLVASLKFRVSFGRDDSFFALNIVKLWSLHDEGRPADVLHQFHSIELVNAFKWEIPSHLAVVVAVIRRTYSQ